MSDHDQTESVITIHRNAHPFDLTMPETPSDPIDGLSEASTSVAINLRSVGPKV
jgi:hypothetical protein